MKAKFEIMVKGDCLQALSEGLGLIPKDALEANVDAKPIGKTDRYDVTVIYVSPDIDRKDFINNLNNQKVSNREPRK